MMHGEETSVVQCSCGRSILCGVRHLEGGLGTLAFYENAASTSMTHAAERIERCPDCGEPLDIARLLVENFKWR
jgi:hypothetical protein